VAFGHGHPLVFIKPKVDFSLVYGKYKININTNVRQIYISVMMVLIFQLGSNLGPSLVFKTKFNRST
jgi:hypothetical protein